MVPIPLTPAAIRTTSESAQIGDHDADVGARQPLPQHERVLRADGDDEGQAGQQAGHEGGGHDRDA